MCYNKVSFFDHFTVYWILCIFVLLQETILKKCGQISNISNSAKETILSFNFYQHKYNSKLQQHNRQWRFIYKKNKNRKYKINKECYWCNVLPSQITNEMHRRTE